jgi:hypothetical protein
MATLLEACNEVLIMIGEREVTNFASPLGKKVRLAYRRAQQFVGILHQWRHLRATVTPSSWLNDTATFTPFTTIYNGVYAPSATLRYELHPVNLETLCHKARISPLTDIPSYYSIAGENKVQLYPQPTVAMQPSISFDVLLKPTIASNPTDVLEGPDSYLDLVTLYAQIVMHRTHTTDLNAAEATLREFETSIHMYRTVNVVQQVSYL